MFIQDNMSNRNKVADFLQLPEYLYYFDINLWIGVDMYIWRNICPTWETIFYLLFQITEKLYHRPSGMSARSLPVVCSRGGLDWRERFANFLPLKISTRILHTFPMILRGRICWKIRSFLSWWSFPLFSWLSSLIQGWYCKEKLIRCQSLQRVKR